MVESKSKVRKAIKNKKVDLVAPVKWHFVVPFIEFLNKHRIMKILGNIPCKNIRINIKQELILMLYILKIIVGIPKVRGSEELLCDIGTMTALGFKEEQVVNGICKRGDANQHGKDYKKKSTA